MTKKQNKNFPLVKVKWADHYIEYGEHDLETVKETAKDAYVGSYAGYLVAKTKRMLVIAGNVWEDGTISDPMYIMRRAVVEYKEYPDNVNEEKVLDDNGPHHA